MEKRNLGYELRLLLTLDNTCVDLAANLIQPIINQYISETGLSYIKFEKDELDCIIEIDDACARVDIDKIQFYQITPDKYQMEFESDGTEYDFGQTDFQYIELCKIIWDKLKEYENQNGVE